MTDAVGRDAGVVSSAVAATRRRGLALCLSGGGYRATLFHLGAVRRLHELGILARVDTISSVSGGSLFAGILADIAIDRGWSRGLAVEHFDRDVAERVRMLARRDLRTVPSSPTWDGIGCCRVRAHDTSSALSASTFLDAR